MSNTRLLKSVVLACMAFAVALSGCTSNDESVGVGGAEVELTLQTPPGSNTEIINTIQADWTCEGDDPFTGVPRPPEMEMINVSTTEGDNPTDPKNRAGILSVRGQPVGDCHYDFVAVSEDMTDGAPNVECQGSLDITIQRDVNQDFLVTMVCIRQNQLGGGDFDALFDECPQIKNVVISPTSQVVGGDINVRTQGYDPDGDDVEVQVLLTNCSGAVLPTNTTVIKSCDDENEVCEEAFNTVVADEAGACAIIVTVTDVGKVLCDGKNFDGTFNTAARQRIRFNSQSPASCGNGAPDGGEECDPPSNPDDAANPDGVWCDVNCQFVDACVPTTRFCQTPTEAGLNPQCADTTCTVPGTPVEGDTPTCDFDLPGSEKLCDLTGTNDGQCDGAGQCEVIPDCTANRPNDPLCTGGTECQGLGDCNAQSVCVYDGTDNINTDCTDDGDGNPGICQGAAGVCTNPCDIGPVDCSGNTPPECFDSLCQRTNGANQGTCQDVANTGASCGTNGTCDAGVCEEKPVAPSCGDGILQGPSTSPAYAGENCDDGNTDPIAPADPGGTFCASNDDCAQGARGQTCNFSTDPGGGACGDAGGSVCSTNDDCPVEGQVCNTAQIGTAGTCIAWGTGLTSDGPCPLNDLGQECTITGVCLPRNPSCDPIAGDTCDSDCLAQGQIMPVACRNSFTNGLSAIPFFNTIDPNGVITSGGAINVDIAGAGAVDAGFLQAAAIALFTDGNAATQLTTATIIAARDTITAESGTTAGANVPFDKQNVPDTLTIPHIPNPATGGETCNPGNAGADCPAGVFKQSCIDVGGSTFECEPCTLSTCAIVVIGGLFVPISTDADGNPITIPGTWTADTDPGPVVFNTNGNVPFPLGAFDSPGAEDSWLTVAAGPAGVQLACTGGVVNEAGTGCPPGGTAADPDCADDFVDPALPGTLIEFPIWP